VLLLLLFTFCLFPSKEQESSIEWIEKILQGLKKSNKKILTLGFLYNCFLARAGLTPFFINYWDLPIYCTQMKDDREKVGSVSSKERYVLILSQFTQFEVRRLLNSERYYLPSKANGQPQGVKDMLEKELHLSNSEMKDSGHINHHTSIVDLLPTRVQLPDF
jgi:hypothetical protein